MPSGQEKTELQKLMDDVEPRLAALEALRRWSKSRHIAVDALIDQLAHRIREYGAHEADSIVAKYQKSKPSNAVMTSYEKGKVQVNSQEKQSKKKKRKKSPQDIQNSKKLPVTPDRRVNHAIKCEKCEQSYLKGWKVSKVGGGFGLLCDFCRNRLKGRRAHWRRVHGSYGSGKA